MNEALRREAEKRDGWFWVRGRQARRDFDKLSPNGEGLQAIVRLCARPQCAPLLPICAPCFGFRVSHTSDTSSRNTAADK